MHVVMLQVNRALIELVKTIVVRGVSVLAKDSFLLGVKQKMPKDYARVKREVPLVLLD